MVVEETARAKVLVQERAWMLKKQMVYVAGLCGWSLERRGREAEMRLEVRQRPIMLCPGKKPC